MIFQFNTTLVGRNQLAEDIWLCTFAFSSGQTLTFEAGQYVLIKIPPGHIQWLSQKKNISTQAMRGVTEGGAVRQYSICSTPSLSGRFELLIQIVDGGVASSYLERLKIGDTVSFQGPAGIFTIKDRSADTIFLATGTGIAPIKSMLEDLLKNTSSKTGKLELFWGLRFRSDVYFLEALKKLTATYNNFTFKICLSREENFSDLEEEFFSRGRVTNYVDPLIQQGFKRDFYICGGHIVVEALRQHVLGLGVTSEKIYFEKFV